MSDHNYSPEEAEAARHTLRILRSTGPSAAVLRVADEVEQEIQDRAARRSNRKRTRSTTARRAASNTPNIRASAG